VNDLFAGALIPGLALVGMYMFWLFLVSTFDSKAAPAIPAEEFGDMSRLEFARRMAKSLVAPIVLIVAVLGSILGGLASPTEAAAVGAIGALMLAGYRLDEKNGRSIILASLSMLGLLVLTASFDLRMQRSVVSLTEWAAIITAIILSGATLWGVTTSVIRTYTTYVDGGTRILVEAMRTTMEISAMVFTILIGAAMFSLVFRGFGGDDMITELLGHMPGGTIGALAAVMLTMFFLGFFLDFLEIIFIVVPIVAPVLLRMEVAPGVLMNPVWLGILMAINLQTSFLTPPFGFALFYLRGVAPASVRTMEIYKGVIPFVLIQIVMMVVLWYLPSLATWLPLTLYGA
jgi:TRAP-type mannitol/chloroaromatic compound transport system permease large subunit